MKRKMKLISFLLTFALIVTSVPNEWTTKAPTAKAAGEKQLVTWDSSLDADALNDDKTVYTTQRTFSTIQRSQSLNASYGSVKLDETEIKEAFGISVPSPTIDSPVYTYQWYEVDEKGKRTLIEDETDDSYYMTVTNEKTEHRYVCTIQLESVDIDGDTYTVADDIVGAGTYVASLDQVFVYTYNGTVVETADITDYFSGIEDIEDVTYTATNRNYSHWMYVNELDGEDYNAYYNYVWTTHYTDGSEESDAPEKHVDAYYNSSIQKYGSLFQENASGVEKQVAYYECTVDLCYGYQVIDTVSKKFYFDYKPFEVISPVETMTVEKARKNGKVKFEVETQINDDEACNGVAYQWYSIAEDGKETAMKGETTSELNVKITDPKVSYKVVVTGKMNAGYKDVKYSEERTFKTSASAGYLVKDKAYEDQYASIGDTVNLYIDARVDEGYSLKYKWEKCSYDAEFNIQAVEVGTDAALEVKPEVVEDFNTVTRGYWYDNYNYRQTVSVMEGDEEIETYVYYYAVMENTSYDIDTNAGTIYSDKGEDVELYVKTEVKPSYTLEKKWYKLFKEMDLVWDQVTSSYVPLHEDETVPADGTYDYGSIQYSRYDSELEQSIYRGVYYKEVVPENEDVLSLKATEDNPDLRGTYVCVVKQYRASDTEKTTTLSSYNYTFTVKYDSELTAYAKNSTVSAEEGSSAKLEVVAANKNEELYPIDYKWEKFVDGEYTVLKDADDKEVKTPVYEIAETTDDDFGTYRVTVSDETGNEIEVTFTLTEKEVEIITFTPAYSTFRKAIGDTVTLTADMSVPEGMDVFYAWYREEDFTFDDDMASEGQGVQDWEIIDQDTNTYAFTLESEDDYTEYKCVAIYKNNNISYTKEFYFDVVPAYSIALERLTPQTQIKKVGDSITYSVRVISDDPKLTEDKITYRWYNEDGLIEGEESSSYQIAALKAEDFQEVYCVAEAPDGSVTSRCTFETQIYTDAYLETNYDVIKAMKSSDVTLAPVILDGDGLQFTYQWYRTTSGYYYTQEIIHGATEQAYKITEIGDNEFGRYSCKIYCEGAYFGTYYVTVSEDEESATVEAEVAEGYESSVEAVLGNSAEFAVEAVSNKDYALKYQWYFEDVAIGGATDAAYKIDVVTPSKLGDYYCVVTDEKGNQSDKVYFDLSATTHLKVESDALDPSDAIGCETTLGGTITLKATATCAAGYEPFYQWYTPDGTLIYGATSATYTISGVTEDDLGVYYCVVTDARGNREYLYYYVYVDTGLYAVPSCKYALAGADGSVKMYVTAKADAGNTISYQWFKWDEEEDEYVEIPGAVSDTYTINPLKRSDYGSYKCMVSTKGERNWFYFELEKSFSIDKNRIFAEQGDDVTVSTKIENPASDVVYSYEWYAEEPVTGTLRKANCQNAVLSTKAPKLGHFELCGDAGYADVEYRCIITQTDKATGEELGTESIDTSIRVLPDITYETSKLPETNHPNDKTYDIQAYKVAGAQKLKLTFDAQSNIGDANMYIIAKDGDYQYWDEDKTVTVEGDSVIILVNGNDRAESYGYKVTSIEAVMPPTPQTPGDSSSQSGQSGSSVGAGTSTPSVLVTKNGETIKKSAKYTAKSAVYQVTGVSGKNKTVTFMGAKSKKATSITIPATVTISGVSFKVTAVGKNAFKGYSKLKTVTIGKNVKTIGAGAFANDKKLTKIVMKGTALKSVGKKAFNKVPKKATVKAPQKSKKAYKKLFKKGGFKGKVK